MEFVFWLLVVVLALSWLGVVVVGAPYVPTLRPGLEKLFKELNIGEGDHLVDLGAGDGRVLTLAAEKGARVTGVEINPFLVLAGRWRLRAYKNSRIVWRNMWQFDLPPETTYVFVFPARTIMTRLEKYLAEQAEDGKKFTVIIHAFELLGQEPDRRVGAFNLYDF